MFSAPQVFLVRKVTGSDTGQLYAMKVLKKATLKGKGPGRGQFLLRHITAVFPGQPEDVMALLSLCGFRNPGRGHWAPLWVINCQCFSGIVAIPAKFVRLSEGARCISSICTCSAAESHAGKEQQEGSHLFRLCGSTADRHRPPHRIAQFPRELDAQMCCVP